MAGISITLGGNFTKLDELKDKAHKTADSIKAAFGSNIGKAMFGGIAAAGTAAFVGIVASIKQAVDRGGELSDVIARTGAGAKGLVILQQVLQNAGMAASQVPMVLNRMQKALAGVNEEGEPTNAAFEKLGLSISELMSLDPVEAFAKIQKSFAAIENPAKRTAIAMEMFGRSGGELLAVFADSSAFATAQKQLGHLPEVYAENVDGLAKVEDAYKALGLKMEQIGAELAVDLLPQLNELSEWSNEADFSEVGKEIGMLAGFMVDLGKSVGKVVELSSELGFLGDIAGWAGGMNPTKGQALPLPGISIDASGNPVYDNAVVASAPVEKDPFAEPGDPKKQAAADREWDQKVKSDERLFSMRQEFDLEMEILRARAAGDADRLDALQREKAMHEDIRRLQAAGFTGQEARSRAEKKAQATKAAADAEKAAERDAEVRDRARGMIEGQLDDVQGRAAGLQFQSTIGAISDMQRIGGGGGAVSSGLDYQRQATDLQREANDLLRQLIDVSRADLDV